MLEGFVFVISLLLCCPSGDVLQSTWSFDLDDTSNDIFLCWSYVRWNIWFKSSETRIVFYIQPMQYIMVHGVNGPQDGQATHICVSHTDIAMAGSLNF
jgi:hypothetical protein